MLILQLLGLRKVPVINLLAKNTMKLLLKQWLTTCSTITFSTLLMGLDILK